MRIGVTSNRCSYHATLRSKSVTVSAKWENGGKVGGIAKTYLPRRRSLRMSDKPSAWPAVISEAAPERAQPGTAVLTSDRIVSSARTRRESWCLSQALLQRLRKCFHRDQQPPPRPSHPDHSCGFHHNRQHWRAHQRCRQPQSATDDGSVFTSTPAISFGQTTRGIPTSSPRNTSPQRRRPRTTRRATSTSGTVAIGPRKRTSVAPLPVQLVRH